MRNLALIYCCLVSIAWASVAPNFRRTYKYDFQQLNDQKDDINEWWRTASFYQIYPRSWKDSNGDGVGDLNGITENLAYLKEIGITATWLSPIFTSPMADFGYDISNFTEIDPTFGSMEDFDKLIKKANDVGIKIILDFVPNHSSDECEWFKKSILKDPEYKDFYIWHPGKVVDNERKPPTNWISVFRGSTWTFNEERGEYYLHQFNRKQPDFNFRNPKVVERLHDVLRFWLKKGVAGFRIDAIPHSVEVAADNNGNYPDEPRNPNSNDEEDYGYLEHIYTVDQPETIDLVYGWRKVLDDFQAENGGDSRVILAESYSPIETVMKYFGNETVNGAQIPFNFLMISGLTNESDAYHYAETMNTWLSHVPEGRTSNWVIGNHDKNRVGSRFGVERIDTMNIILNTMPGCAVTYQGEEIGMLDVWISWNDTVDPQACGTNPSIYESFSRDPARTPFQWNDQHMAGFTTGYSTWLPVSDDYEYINVKTERGAARSHLNLYKQLKKLRQEQTLQKGDVNVVAHNNEVLIIKRSLANDYTYISISNIGDNFHSVNLANHYSDLGDHLNYDLVNDRSSHRQGDVVLTNRIILLPKESVILRSQNKITTAETDDYYKYVSN